MGAMDMCGGQIMLMAPPWMPGYAALIFLMWAIMMVAMMLVATKNLIRPDAKA
jgi:predicted metal-binding membrane protein